MEPQKPEVANIYPLKFYTKFSYDEAGNVNGEHEWCTWAKKGVRNPFQVPQPISLIKRDPAKWSALEPYYAQWKRGKELSAQGTPLEAWPAITEEERRLIKAKDIHTLEDFAQLTDTFIGEIGFPHAHKKRDNARNFLRVRDEQETVSELQAKIKELEAQVLAKPAADFKLPEQINQERADQEAEKALLKDKLKALGVAVRGRPSLKKLRQMAAEAGLDEPTNDSAGHM